MVIANPSEDQSFKHNGVTQEKVVNMKASSQRTASSGNGKTSGFKPGMPQSGRKPLNKAVRQMGRQAGEFMNRAKKSANGYVETAREYVNEKPGRSLAISAAAGVATGSILTLTMRRRK